MSVPSPVQNHGGYWRTSWYDDDGERRWKSFGSARTVSRATAQAEYIEWLVTWKLDAKVRNPGRLGLTVSQLATGTKHSRRSTTAATASRRARRT